jgi:hypothetical protein
MLALLGNPTGAQEVARRAVDAASQFDASRVADLVWERYEALVVTRSARPNVRGP